MADDEQKQPPPPEGNDQEQQQPDAAKATPEPAADPAPQPPSTSEGAAAPAAEIEPAAEAEAPAQGATAKEPPLQAALDAFRETNQSAFIAGFTGECGKALVLELARTKIFSKVVLIGRREVTLEGDEYKDFAVEHKVVDYDNLDASVDAFQGPTVGYCCLGTTKGKAGKEGFKKVDHDYVMKVGELAKQNGCQQYHLVSAVGANAKSSMLYSKVKGQVEDETAELGFEKFSIYRPGLLMCPRKEFRFAERVSQIFLKPIDYLTPGTITNTTISVAQAMIARTVKPAEDAKDALDGKSIYRASKDITG